MILVSHNIIPAAKEKKLRTTEKILDITIYFLQCWVNVFDLLTAILHIHWL